MSRSQVQSVILQSTVLAALNMIISHEIGRNAYNEVWEDPVVKNLTSVFNSIPINATASNIDISRSSNSAGNLVDIPEAFYTSMLPRILFVRALLCPLDYYYEIYLERLLPTRPRGAVIDYDEQGKVVIDMNEDREEKIVKRWIAKGKVRRSTVSWSNIFIKWIFDITFGYMWGISLYHFVDGCIRRDSPLKILGNFKQVGIFPHLRSFT